MYKISAQGKIEKLIADTSMNHPNGIWNDEDSLVVVAFGGTQILTLNQGGVIEKAVEAPSGGLDGLVKHNGRYLISSWKGKAVYAMTEDGSFSVFAKGLEAPADMDIDSKRNLLLVPLFKQDKVVAIPL